MLSFRIGRVLITNPYLAGSNFYVEVVAASYLDAVSTSCPAVAVAVVAVAVAAAAVVAVAVAAVVAVAVADM